MLRRRPFVALIVLLVAVAGAAVWFAGRDDPDDAATPTAPIPSATASPTPGAGGAELAAQYLTATPAPAVGGVDGTLEIAGSPVPARVDVLAVQTDDRSTVLRWRLSAQTAGAPKPNVFSRSFTDSDTSAITLVSQKAQQRLVPGTYVQGVLNRCACAKQPTKVGPDGVEMSAIFAALPADVQEVEVRIPTFDPVTVPVTRS